MGFTLIGKRVLEEFKAPGEHLSALGPGHSVPAYFDQPVGSGEDSSFFRRAQEQDFVVGCDYDLWTGHSKKVELNSPR